MSINGSKIYVLPCLQELKAQKVMIGRLIGYEYEQQPGKWDAVKKQLTPLFSGALYGTANATDYFDKYWNGTSIPDSKVTKEGLLDIPNCNSYGFKTECKKMNCSDKWKMYTQFLKSKCPSNNNNVALMVTHHNRMRDKDPFQGLIPFKKNTDLNSFNAYANNFCLKISINIVNNQPIITYSIFFPGFPDKGEFNTNCIIPELQSGGGDEYNYACQIGNESISNYIDTTSIENGIKSALIDGESLNLDIYLVRHGNSLHNKPVNASDAFTPEQNRLDSCLTPLGMFQADLIGKYFMSQGVFNNTNIIFCASFLQRTQLTGLLILKSAGIKMESMQGGLDLMENQALVRYSRIAPKFDASKFLSYPPIGTKKNPIKNKVFADEFLKFFKGLETKLPSDEVPSSDQVILDNFQTSIQQIEQSINSNNTVVSEPSNTSDDNVYPGTDLPITTQGSIGGKKRTRKYNKYTKKQKKYSKTKKIARRQHKKNKK